MKNLNELQKEVLKTFEILVEPGQFTEVRILKNKGLFQAITMM